MRLSKNATRWILGLTTMTLFGCDPIPRRTLSAEEKVADLYWIYSQFGENYAPLEYKEKRYNFDFAKLKQDYVEKAKQTTTNDEFYDLMFQLVSEFKDAHTSAALTDSSLPDRAKVAFLGFSGIRDGDTLLVKKLLPTISDESAYPIKVGDVIKKIDGVALKDAVKAELVKFRDLGYEEANITYHMNKLFTRISTANGLPKTTDSILVVERDGKDIDVTLPWVTKDLYQFQAEQAKATADKNKKSGGVGPEEEHAENFLMVSGDQKSTLFKFNFIGFDGRIEKPFDNMKKIMSGMTRKFADGFRFMDNFSEWAVVADEKDADAKEKSPLEKLAETRKVLKGAIYLSDAKTYPAYVAPVAVKDADGKETGEKKLVGYISVDTFSPAGDSKEVLEQFTKTLLSMQDLGVKDLIIDTLNNGGGSLELGMMMAQKLSNKKIEMPKMQFRLSDTWLDQFQSESIEGASDAEKEYSRRLLADMSAQQKAGQRLSNPYSAEVLAPFAITANEDLEQSFNTVVLVNEMCASMCDIFAGIVQDNKMATIVGTRSMGAGGNVVNHNQAPNSHLDVRQTESLMIRKDKTYLENNGVTPDVVVDTFSGSKEKYETVLKKAIEVLTVKKKEAAPAATPAAAPTVLTTASAQ
jgi:C-terminal processing protease CtpA/Prc